MQGSCTTLHLINYREDHPQKKISKIMETTNFIIELPYKGQLLNWLTETGEPAYTAYRNFEDYKEGKQKEGIEIALLSWEEYDKLNTSYWERDFTEISEEDYYSALYELPPLKWHCINETLNVFFCMEATSGIFNACYLKNKISGKFFSGQKSRFSSDAEILLSYSKNNA